MITITPFGAAGEVTGSSYLVTTDESRILIDFGMFQGDKDDDARNVIPGKIQREKLDCIILTHAHLDHSGRLPLIVRDGYRNPIYSTPATREMAEVILSDSAHIQVSDFERKVRRLKKAGRKINRNDSPMYEAVDVVDTMELFVDVHYNSTVQVAKGITATFLEAGHMLGSASISLRIESGSGTKNVVFSGDVGPENLPFMKDPTPPVDADVVVMESTYGDREHRSQGDTILQFAGIIQKAIATNGKIFIPSFAIGRSQQVMYHLAQLIRTGLIPPIPIYLDSPMAIEALALYKKYHAIMDREGRDWLENGQITEDLKTLTLTNQAQDSRMINDAHGPFIVIAGAGMCNAGRIVHHLVHNISDPNSHVVIVGYQARGSLGRYLVDGASHVTIMGERKIVRAEIHTLGGLSAHAGQTDLLNWYRNMGATKPLTILTHGEEKARIELSKAIKKEFDVECRLPMYGDQVSL